MSGDRPTYLDSSAIVKLVRLEPESDVLRRHLRRRGPLVSSGLARVEVVRAVALGSPAHVGAAHAVLDRLRLIRVTDRVLASAATLGPMDIRSLDAIHLATAALLGPTLSSLVTYDRRMAAAAEAMGLRVAAPGATA
ncbi:MAG TPA: type II toxin-antitoxin system VapC family toxin [Acidimicrobiales bacterium]|jgi:hypothetical protein